MPKHHRQRVASSNVSAHCRKTSCWWRSHEAAFITQWITPRYSLLASIEMLNSCWHKSLLYLVLLNWFCFHFCAKCWPKSIVSCCLFNLAIMQSVKSSLRVSTKPRWTGPDMRELVENMCDKIHFERLQAHISSFQSRHSTALTALWKQISLNDDTNDLAAFSNRFPHAEILKCFCQFTEAVRRCASFLDK